MTIISARIPQVDWRHGFDRHWNGGNPAVTHAFNALSFLFPQGEQFFIEIAREVASTLNTTDNVKLASAVKGFVAQEATHSRQHKLYNAILEKQGYENVVYAFVSHLQQQAHRHLSPLTKLAVVCGYEHYTAILGNFLLKNPDVLKSATPDMALIWGWHAAEETEHKAVCFDLYQASGGSGITRVLVFVVVSIEFFLVFGRLYGSLLHRDGCLKASKIFTTTRQFLRFYFGKPGVAWHLLGHGLRYLSPWFHPWNQDNRRQMQAWFCDNQTRLREITPPH